MRRRVTGNLLWMLAERGLQVGCGIAIVAMLARALGPVGFAHFQYAQSVVLVAGSLAFVCSAEVIVPRLVAAPSPTAEQELVLHALILRLLGAFSGYLLMYAFLGVTSASADVWQAALLLGVAFLLREPFGVAIAWMQAHINNRPGTLFSLLALAVKMALVVGLVLLGASSVADFASAIAIEAVVLAVLLSAYYVRKTPRQAIVWQLPLMRELVSTGSLFWVSFLLM
ncbi:MAG TPA: lipopolysaccharide biosynthesis protein, partial [Cupriavidus sp.]|nr:lipopolysaccharide biosynthesis protein [Cupriavidus sp.]